GAGTAESAEASSRREAWRTARSGSAECGERCESDAWQRDPGREHWRRSARSRRSEWRRSPAWNRWCDGCEAWPRTAWDRWCNKWEAWRRTARECCTGHYAARRQIVNQISLEIRAAA